MKKRQSTSLKLQTNEPFCDVRVRVVLIYFMQLCVLIIVRWQVTYKILVFHFLTKFCFCMNDNWCSEKLIRSCIQEYSRKYNNLIAVNCIQFAIIGQLTITCTTL